MKNPLQIKKLDNGTTIVAEHITDVASAALVIMIPTGSTIDPKNRSGATSVLSELLFRGAGDLNNRQLNEKLDGLGLQRGNGASKLHSRFSVAMVADQLPETLSIFADIIRRPHLASEDFDMCKQLALQSLEGIEDDPRQKISLLTSSHYLPTPFNRPTVGVKSDLEALTIEELTQHHKNNFTPNGAIISIAGNIDPQAVIKQVEDLYGDWVGDKHIEPDLAKSKSGNFHTHNDGAQIHIGLMYQSVNCNNPQYYPSLLANGILSGGMGSRLFTEVREKRALCYAVSASQQIIGPYGVVRGYLGSTPEQAQEGLDVMLNEIENLANNISKDELERSRIGLRANLIMAGESTSARASHAAGDIYHFDKVRSLESIEDQINKVTLDDVVSFAKTYIPRNITVCTLGPNGLNVDDKYIK